MGLASAAVLVLALGSWGTPDHVGFAVMYAPNVMEARAKAHHAPPALCYVAYTLAHDEDMARLWLRVEGPAGTLECLVVDLPDDSRGHRQPLIDREVWVELDFKSGKRICGLRWKGKATECPVRVYVIGKR